MIVTGATPLASMEIRVPLTASQFAIGSVSLGSGSVAGDLIVNGTLFANEFKTNVVSSSIIYRSGSTKQGDSLDDIHEVTGSLRVVGSISGSLSGAFFGTEGLTGSLQRLVSEQTYLAAGPGITVITQSNGQVLITASTGSVLSTNFFVPREVKYVIFSGTTGHVTATLSDDPHLWQEHVFKDADGLSTTNNIIISASAGHRIDGGFGHEISSSYGRARLLFVGNGLWSLIN